MTEWESLKHEWLSARNRASAAQNELDHAFEEYLVDEEPQPFKKMQKIMDDLRYREAEARGRMDQYISEHG